MIIHTVLGFVADGWARQEVVVEDSTFVCENWSVKRAIVKSIWRDWLTF